MSRLIVGSGAFYPWHQIPDPGLGINHQRVACGRERGAQYRRPGASDPPLERPRSWEHACSQPCLRGGGRGKARKRADVTNGGEPLTVVRTIPATPHDVFNAWTQQELLQRWWVDSASTDPRVGGRFRQETRDAAGEHVVSGVYREFEPDRHLAMTWKYEGALETGADEKLVTIDLRERDGGRTEVRVTEDPVKAADRADAEAAWGAALGALEELLGERRGT